MKYFVALVLIMLFGGLNCAAVSAVEKRGQNVSCSNCHGMPPLSASDPGSFNPGAHDIHRDIGCGECHVMNGEKHIDGIISILQELNYSEGVDIAWPGSGTGRCGGNNFLRSAGCHLEKKDLDCYWLPGRICKPVSAP